MTRWGDLWAKPSNMIAMGVEVRTASWLEQVEQEGYRMEAKLEAIRAKWKNRPDLNKVHGSVHGLNDAWQKWNKEWLEVLGE